MIRFSTPTSHLDLDTFSVIKKHLSVPWQNINMFCDFCKLDTFMPTMFITLYAVFSVTAAVFEKIQPCSALLAKKNQVKGF